MLHLAQISVQAVLFDLDGTLLNSLEQYNRALTAAIDECGLEPPSSLRIRQSMGLPGMEVLQVVGVPPDRARDVWLRWIEWEIRLSDLVHPYPGVAPLLEKLRAASYRLGIVTSRTRITLNAIPAAMDLLSLVDLLVTRDDTDKGKPHPAPIIHALERLGISPSQGIYVGDAAFDIEAGRRAGCLTVLSTWDGAGRPRPAELEPDFLAASPDELAALLLDG
jgi:pyrophosphatase PpaX